MQNNDFRAKQFMPFDALKGLKEAIKLVDNKGTLKKVLSDDIEKQIDNQLRKIDKYSEVTIKYFKDMNYIETTGVVKKIDLINKCLYILNSKIYFDDILNIETKK